MENLWPELWFISPPYFAKRHRCKTKWKFERVILAWKRKAFIPIFSLRKHRVSHNPYSAHIAENTWVQWRKFAQYLVKAATYITPLHIINWTNFKIKSFFIININQQIKFYNSISCLCNEIMLRVIKIYFQGQDIFNFLFCWFRQHCRIKSTWRWSETIEK